MRSRLAPYFIALAALGVALLVRALLDPWLGERVPYVSVFGALIVAAWYGGARPALAAAALGWLGAQWWFVEPRGTIAFGGVPQALELAAYLLSSLLIAAGGGAMYRARRRAEQSEGRFRGFMQHTPNSVFLKDEEGRYVFVNRSAQELIGRADWGGRTDEELLAPAIAREIRAHDRDVLESGAPRFYDLRFATAENERVLRSVKFPLTDAEGRRYVGSITMDVTRERQSEAQLQFVTDTVSAALIHCAADTRVIWVNRVYCDWIAKPMAEIVGRPLAEVIGEAGLANIRPHIDAVLGGGTPSYERLADYPGLGRRWVAASYTPSRGPGGEITGWVAVVYDINKRKESEQELAQAQNKLQQVADAMPAVVTLCSRDLRYLWVNELAALWLRRTPQEVIGRSMEEVIGSRALADIRPYIERVLAGEPVMYEREAEYPAVGRRWVNVRFAPVPGGAWVAVITDIDSRKKMEQALEEAGRRKDEFLATLVHELRNTLAPIRTAVAILGRDAVAEKDRAWSRAVIERQVAHMTRLIDDLLDVARISSGKLLVGKERVALGSVIAAALETSRPHIEAAGQRLLTRLPPEPLVLEADATRLAQMLSNLLNNAAKYTPAGGTISLGIESGGGEVLIVVEDTGRGFPPELAERIFEPFVQWAADQAADAGLGIGLSLVRGIVVLHGGTVNAASGGPGKGSRFEVRLPLARLAPVVSSTPASAEHASARSGVRVVVADDNRDAADALERLLALYGYEVKTAYEGTGALALCESFRPRVVLLDIGMPGASGYEVAQRLRDRYGESMALIALTGWGQQADVRRAREAGFDRHLTKPVDPALLDEAISSAAAARA
ncbi:MAG: PAS domain-containing protein [Burkholderiales bacterium]